MFLCTIVQIRSVISRPRKIVKRHITVYTLTNTLECESFGGWIIIKYCIQNNNRIVASDVDDNI